MSDGPLLGEPAPLFTVPGTTGQVSLAGLLEQGPVVLAFYSEDLTELAS